MTLPDGFLEPHPARVEFDATKGQVRFVYGSKWMGARYIVAWDLESNLVEWWREDDGAGPSQVSHGRNLYSVVRIINRAVREMLERFE